MNLSSKLFLGAVALVGVGMINSLFSTPYVPTPEQTAAAAQQEKVQKRNLMAMNAVSALKSNVRDPKSFEAKRVLVMESGAVCIEYRAKNGFGGYASDAAVVLGTLLSGDVGVYNKLCADKVGVVIDNAFF